MTDPGRARGSAARLAQAALLLPSTIALGGLAIVGALAGVLGGLVAPLRGVDSIGAGLVLRALYLVMAIVLLVVPAVGLGLLWTLIWLGPETVAGRRHLRRLCWTIGAPAVIVAAELCRRMLSDSSGTYGRNGVVLSLVAVPMLLGVGNLIALARAGRRETERR